MPRIVQSRFKQAAKSKAKKQDDENVTLADISTIGPATSRNTSARSHSTPMKPVHKTISKKTSKKPAAKANLFPNTESTLLMPPTKQPTKKPVNTSAIRPTEATRAERPREDESNFRNLKTTFYMRQLTNVHRLENAPKLVDAFAARRARENKALHVEAEKIAELIRAKRQELSGLETRNTNKVGEVAKLEECALNTIATEGKMISQILPQIESVLVNHAKMVTLNSCKSSQSVEAQIYEIRDAFDTRSLLSDLENAIDYDVEVKMLKATLAKIESIKNRTTELNDTTEKLKKERTRKQWMRDVNDEYNSDDFWSFDRFKNMMH